MQPVWSAFNAGHIQLISSELSLLETLVHPIRFNDSKLIDSYMNLLTDSALNLVPIEISTLTKAAELRASLNLKTPDAIRAAAAINSGCDYLIANDGAFRRLTSIDVIILSDLL